MKEPIKHAKIIEYGEISVLTCIDSTIGDSVRIVISHIIDGELKKYYIIADAIDKALKFIYDFNEERARMYVDYLIDQPR